MPEPLGGLSRGPAADLPSGDRRDGGALLGVDAVRIWHDQALYKEPGGRETDPHQDQPYWPIVEADTITAWIPFDGSTSRTAPWATSREATGSACASSWTSSPAAVTIRWSGASSRIAPVFVEVPPGSVAFHHGLTFHLAKPNLTHAAGCTPPSTSPTGAPGARGASTPGGGAGRHRHGCGHRQRRHADRLAPRRGRSARPARGADGDDEPVLTDASARRGRSRASSGSPASPLRRRVPPCCAGDRDRARHLASAVGANVGPRTTRPGWPWPTPRTAFPRSSSCTGTVFPRFALSPGVVDAVAQLIAPDIDVFLSQFIFKTAGAWGQPWHQDSFYFPFEPARPVVGVWLAVTAATLVNGCLHVLPGSQAEPIHTHMPDRRPGANTAISRSSTTTCRRAGAHGPGRSPRLRQPPHALLDRQRVRGDPRGHGVPLRRGRDGGPNRGVLPLPQRLGAGPSGRPAGGSVGRGGGWIDAAEVRRKAAGATPPPAAELGRRASEAGRSGLVVTEAGRTAYLTCGALVVAASLHVWTGIAVAFPRSPRAAAATARQPAEASGGRFRLGPGVQVRAAGPAPAMALTFERPAPWLCGATSLR